MEKHSQDCSNLKPNPLETDQFDPSPLNSMKTFYTQSSVRRFIIKAEFLIKKKTFLNDFFCDFRKNRGFFILTKIE